MRIYKISECIWIWKYEYEYENMENIENLKNYKKYKNVILYCWEVWPGELSITFGMSEVRWPVRHEYH